MEEKKFDINTIIGFVLIGAILLYMLYINQPTPEEIEAEKAKTEQVVEENKSTDDTIEDEETVKMDEKSYELTETDQSDSLKILNLENRLGSFSYSSKISSAKDNITVLENEVLYLAINNKGGYITEA